MGKNNKINNLYMKTFIAVLVLATVAHATSVERRMPRLVNKGWSPKHKLGYCQGDCDSHHHCKKGLVCFTRGAAHRGAKAQAYSNNPYQNIPGCIGRGVASMDYCVTPAKRNYFLKNRKRLMGRKWYHRQMAAAKKWIQRRLKSHRSRLSAHRRRMHAKRRAHHKRVRAHRRRLAHHRRRMNAKRRAYIKRVRAHRRRMLHKRRAYLKRIRAHRKRLAAHRRRRYHARRRAHSRRMASIRKRRAYLARRRAHYIRMRKIRNRKVRAMWRARRAAEKRARIHLARQRRVLMARLAKRQPKVAAAAPCTTCNQGPHITMKSTTLVVKHI